MKEEKKRKYEDLDPEEVKAVLSNIKDVFRSYSFCLDKILDSCQEQNIVYDNTEKRLVMSLLFSKAIKTYFAIYSLCKEGYGGEAIVLFRTLMEMNFNLRFIYYSDDKYAKRFLDYHDFAIYKYNLPKKNRPYVEANIGNIDGNHIKYKKGYEEFEKNYPDGRRDTWSGKNIYDMLVCLPEEIRNYELKDYDSFYQMTSFHVHSNIVSIKDRISTGGEFKINPNLEYLKIIFPMSTHYIIKIISLWLLYMEAKVPVEYRKNLYDIQYYAYTKFNDDTSIEYPMEDPESFN